MQLSKKLFAAATLVLTTLSLAAGVPGEASAATTTSVAVPNPSFDEGWLDKKLKCWNVDRADVAKLTVTKNTHSGPSAASVTGSASANTALVLASDRTDACQIPVAAGRQYAMSFWANSTAGVQPVVAAFSPANGWTTWYAGTKIPAGAVLNHHSVSLPAVPNGVTRLSVGVSFPGNSKVVLDDVGLRETDAALFKAAFPQSGLVTNEFAYWNPADPQRVESSDWEMTSGSMFARDGNGYTGTINNNLSNAKSTTGTGSDIFRLNTRNYSFENVQVSMKLNISRLVTTSRTPAVDWDGVHIFLRYQSQYELYYASVARRDGHVVVKKKCLGGPSNGGAYYALGNSEVSGLAFPLNSWQDVGASIRTNTDGSVAITLLRGGKIVSSAIDNGVGCAPIRTAGASGIRGDNAEFQFNNFTVVRAG
jgi:hypothetical protein